MYIEFFDLFFNSLTYKIQNSFPNEFGKKNLNPLTGINFTLSYLIFLCGRKKCIRFQPYRLSNSEASTKFILTRASQTLKCIRIICGFCYRAHSDSAGPVYNLGFRICNDLPGDTSAATDPALHFEQQIHEVKNC